VIWFQATASTFLKYKTSCSSLTALDMNLEKHNNTEIPSLAINWVNPEDLMHITHMQQVFKPHAAPYTAADPKLHCDSTLILNGIYVDRITGVGTSWPQK
jgi:hypothetical protein